MDRHIVNMPGVEIDISVLQIQNPPPIRPDTQKRISCQIPNTVAHHLKSFRKGRHAAGTNHDCCPRHQNTDGRNTCCHLRIYLQKQIIFSPQNNYGSRIHKQQQADLRHTRAGCRKIEQYARPHSQTGSGQDAAGKPGCFPNRKLCFLSGTLHDQNSAYSGSHGDKTAHRQGQCQADQQDWLCIRQSRIPASPLLFLFVLFLQTVHQQKPAHNKKDPQRIRIPQETAQPCRTAPGHGAKDKADDSGGRCYPCPDDTQPAQQQQLPFLQT